MKILQVHTRYRQEGGEDSVVRSERQLLTEGGHEVYSLELENPTSPVDTAKQLVLAPWNASASRAVASEAKRIRADVVHVHNTWFALSPRVFREVRHAGFPVVATMHNYRLMCVNAMLYRDGRVCEECVGVTPWRGVLHKCYRGSAILSGVVAVTIGTHRLARTWSDDLNLVIALTSFAANLLVASGLPRERIVVKPNVVADPGPRPLPASASRRLLFVGRLTEEKGIVDLLDAWNDAELDLQLEVVGDGPLMPTVTSIGGHATIAGAVPGDEVRRRMLGSRALVLPSRWYEGLPMVLIEALACGLPVVVPAHGALPQIAGRAGVLFTPGDPADLTKALHQVQDDELVEEKSAAALREYRRRFSLEAGLSQLEAIYRRAIDEDSTSATRKPAKFDSTGPSA